MYCNLHFSDYPPYLPPGIGSGGTLVLEDYSTVTVISALEQTPLDVSTVEHIMTLPPSWEHVTSLGVL